MNHAYGRQRLSLSHRGFHRHGCTSTRLILDGIEQTITFRKFPATYPPAGGRIRVVIVQRSDGLFAESPAAWVAFFSTDPDLSAETITTAAADRSAIEQNFHDVREVHGSDRQQLWNAWCNFAFWNLCLWLHSLVELWSWRRPGATLKQRADRPWNTPIRRPGHADCLKTLRKQVMRESFSSLPRGHCTKQKNPDLLQGPHPIGHLN